MARQRLRRQPLRRARSVRQHLCDAGLAAARRRTASKAGGGTGSGGKRGFDNPLAVGPAPDRRRTGGQERHRRHAATIRSASASSTRNSATAASAPSTATSSPSISRRPARSACWTPSSSGTERRRTETPTPPTPNSFQEFILRTGVVRPRAQLLPSTHPIGGTPRWRHDNEPHRHNHPIRHMAGCPAPPRTLLTSRPPLRGASRSAPASALSFRPGPPAQSRADQRHERRHRDTGSR